MDQLSFASLDFAAEKKRTKRAVFLAEMAAWKTWWRCMMWLRRSRVGRSKLWARRISTA